MVRCTSPVQSGNLGYNIFFVGNQLWFIMTGDIHGYNPAPFANGPSLERSKAR